MNVVYERFAIQIDKEHFDNLYTLFYYRILVPNNLKVVIDLSLELVFWQCGIPNSIHKVALGIYSSVSLTPAHHSQFRITAEACENVPIDFGFSSGFCQGIPVPSTTYNWLEMTFWQKKWL